MMPLGNRPTTNSVSVWPEECAADLIGYMYG